MTNQMTDALSDTQILMNVAAKATSVPARQVRDAEPSAPDTASPKAALQPLDWNMFGFSGKSKIVTSFGNLPIEALRRNDPVKIASGAFRKITWVDKITLDPEFMSLHPDAQPVLIPAGSLSAGKPAVDMFVSPAQPVQSSGFHGSISFKKGSELIKCGSATTKPQASFTYYIFGCDQPVSVNVDGIWCETHGANSRTQAED